MNTARATLSLPRLGLGTAPLGTRNTPFTDGDAVATIRAALNHGITFFDTAPLYGDAERRLGLALDDVPRANYALATKVGNRVPAGGELVEDYSHDGILRSVEESLTRLKTDRLDVVHIHEPYLSESRPAVFAPALPALHELRDQGIVGKIGAGVNDWTLVQDLVRSGGLDCLLLAGHYNLLDRDAADTFFPLCHQQSVDVIAAGVFATGILATGPEPGAQYRYREAPPQILQRVAQLQTTCTRHEVPLAAAAVQFPYTHPAVTTVVAGARYAHEVDSLANAARHPIPSQLWDEM